MDKRLLELAGIVIVTEDVINKDYDGLVADIKKKLKGDDEIVVKIRKDGDGVVYSFDDSDLSKDDE